MSTYLPLVDENRKISTQLKVHLLLLLLSFQETCLGDAKQT